MEGFEKLGRCPQCHKSQLSYSPDGYDIMCDLCNYRQMVKARPQMQKSHQPLGACPQCHQSTLVYTADGKAIVCEKCNHQMVVEVRIPPPEEIIYTNSLIGQQTQRRDRDRMTSSEIGGVRSMLVLGREAVRQNDRQEAYKCLSKLLLMNPEPQESSDAWYWLSEIYDEPEHKKRCLKESLSYVTTNALALRGLALVEGRIQADELVNPDQLPQSSTDTSPIPVQAEHFTCPQCTGHMNYTPDASKVRCDFCGYEQEATAVSGETRFGQGPFEQDFIAAMATAKGHRQPTQMRTFLCQGCGIEFLLTPEILSVTCPYCTSVYVTEAAENRETVSPHALIPFALNQEEAQKQIRHWFKERNIQKIAVSALVGVYLPVWTFDIGGEIGWQGYEHKNKQKVRHSGISGISYDDVLVPATKKLPAKLLQKALAKFDLTQLVAYDPHYLADWPAERYQIALSDAAIQGRKQVVRDIRQRPYQITDEGMYLDEFQIRTSGMLIESFKHILLPVWILHYKLDGKIYDVIVNGQTKEVVGDWPQSIVGSLVSWLKGE